MLSVNCLLFFSEEASDPGLAQFSKMVKCLSQQQGGRLGSSLSGPEWNQFNTMPGMQFVPNWNNPNANRPRQQQPNPGGGNWPQQGSQPRPGVNRNDWRGGVGRPGVQQQQWPQGQGQGGLGQQQGPQQRPYDRGTVWGKTKDREEDQDNNERQASPLGVNFVWIVALFLLSVLYTVPVTPAVHCSLLLYYEFR